MDIKKWNLSFFLKNKVDCLNYVKENYQMVPYLNVNASEYVSNNSLVRFRGMVQDMYDPEYYLEKCEVINTITSDRCSRSGKYVDSIHYNDDEVLDVENLNNVSSERQTFVVTSVPGLSTWVNEIENTKYKMKNENQEIASHNNKRALDVSEDTDIPTETNIHQNKKISNSTDTEASKQTLSKEHLLNIPIPDNAGKTCHVKVYENNNSIKLNEIYDFVGFLSGDIISTEVEDRDDFTNEMEIQTHNPPTSLIPRIHCISWTKVEHLNPLVENTEIKVNTMKFIKREFQLILTEIMIGDELAADYLLYHLLSKVYLRRELLPLGSFTLNISNIPVLVMDDYIEKLYQFIENLVTNSYYLPMTLDNMNNLTFTPKKDYICNRLTSGLLQLSEGTHLILDETKLSSGKLNESGIKAVAAINGIIKCQKVTYDFNYYNMEFECDIPVLILSEGKSLLPSDSHVVLKPSEIRVHTFNEIFDAVAKILTPNLLNNLRTYLTTARNLQYEITDAMLDTVQSDFVNLRQTDKITADDLHQLLVLSRLICISEGKSTLDEECWKIACNLENSRKSRL